MRTRIILTMVVMSLLCGLAPLAADSLIQHGIDVFTTPADGSTYYDFAKSPLPAGFFCKSSQPFTGRVAFKGLPLATVIPGQLRGSDTIIERLDDASFDAKGRAVTRIQFRALSLVSIAPVKTACGSFHVYVSLAGQQRLTAMRIYQTEKNGGSFVAPLAVDARMTFIPVKPARNKAARKLEATASFTFPPRPLPWSFVGTMAKKFDDVVVDTNGDLTPDTEFPGTSNFAPGRLPAAKSGDDGSNCPCNYPACHSADGEEHCYFTTPPDCPVFEIC